MRRPKAYVALAQALMDQGITTLFGVIGDGNMPYLSAYTQRCGGRYVGAVDERGAVSMADGFARTVQGVGVASVTHGPGLTNALTALTEAAYSRIPLVLLTSEPPASKPHHHQRIDTEAFVRPTGANYRCALTSEQVVEELGRSLYQATVEQRPVVLNIPVHLLESEVETTTTTYGARRRRVVPPDPDGLDAAAGILASARSPIIVAGRGAIAAGATGELVKLADLLQAPLATTVPARNLFKGHRLNLGIMGGLSHDVALDTIVHADAIVSFGASLNDRTTESGSLLEGKAVVQCGNDPARLDLYHTSDAPLCGDARSSATALIDMLESAGIGASARRDDLEQRLASLTHERDRRPTSSGSLDSRVAADHLSRILPDEYALVTDGGRFTRAVWKHFQGAPPPADIQTNNFGSIGLGLATAIGVATACPDMVTVCAMGDGGGMMGLKEFTTAVRNRLPLVVTVFNDGCYGAEYPKLIEMGMEADIALSDWPSFADMAVAMGGHGHRVTSVEEIDALGPQVFERDGLPVLVEVIADPQIDLRG